MLPENSKFNKYYLAIPIFILFIVLNIYATHASTGELIEFQDCLFNFGWSTDLTDRMKVNEALIFLNNRGLSEPSIIPIQEDSGPYQSNDHLMY